MSESTDFDRFSSDYRQILDRSVAVSGERAEYFAEYKARYIARVVGSNFNGKILDYGCGVGLLAGFLKKHLPGAAIHGYDLSRQSIDMVPKDFGSPSLIANKYEQ